MPISFFENITSCDGSNDILTPCSQDASVKVLELVLGKGWDSYLFMDTEGPSGAGAAFAAMMLTENAIILTVSVLIFVLIMGMGVIGSAKDGVPLGKKYSTLWTPVRAALGVGFLSPLPWAGGYSMLQALLLWFTSLGIGAADTMEQAVLDYARENAGVLVAPSFHEDNRALTANILKTMMIRQYYSQYEDVPPTEWKWRWVVPHSPTVMEQVAASFDEFYGFVHDAFSQDDSTDEQTYGLEATADSEDYEWATGYFEITFPPPEGSGLKTEDLGIIHVPCISRPEEEASCRVRKRALDDFLKAMDLVAFQLLSHYAGGPEENYTPGSVAAAEGQLAYLLQRSAIDQLSSDGGRVQERFDNTLDDMSRLGWMYLGSYHWILSGQQEKILDAIRNKLPNIGPNEQKFIDRMSLFGESMAARMRGHFKTAEMLARADAQPLVHQDMIERASMVTENSIFDRILRALSTPFNFAIETGTDAISNGDPIANLQTYGKSLITAAETAFAAAVVARAASGNIVADAVGITEGARAVWPLVIGIIGTIFIAAMVLTYYLPSVPFIIWTLGFVGWVILVIEVLVAAPIWALAHILPEGEGLAGQHGRHGYMLFLRVLFQPMLMVVGFFTSIILMYAISKPIGAMMELFWAGSSHGINFLLGMIAYLIILCMLYVTLAHKIFGLCTWIPDHVMRWIGQSVHSLGESGDEERVERRTYTGLAGVGSGVGAARRTAQQQDQQSAHRQMREAQGGGDGGSTDTDKSALREMSPDMSGGDGDAASGSRSEGGRRGLNGNIGSESPRNAGSTESLGNGNGISSSSCSGQSDRNGIGASNPRNPGDYNKRGSETDKSALKRLPPDSSGRR